MLPKPPVPPRQYERPMPRRLPERKQLMTIAAGFVCTDGLLLATDTLYTGINQRFGRKLWSMPIGDAIVAVGGSGPEGALLRIKDEIGQRLNPTATLADWLVDADWILQYVIDIENRGGTGDKPEVFLGIRKDGQTGLYFSHGGVWARFPEEAPVRCLGWAAGLGQYIADSLCPAGGFSMQLAKIVAVHLIKQAKTYSGYCGGDTHILEVPIVGEPRFVDNQQETGGLEQYLGDVFEAMRMVLPDDLTPWAPQTPVTTQSMLKTITR
jgi:hypothetical protein